jgi:predicted ATPase
LTLLLGRKKELADVRRLVKVDGARLVTVTGPPGIGKTRFANECARELAVRVADDATPTDVGALGGAAAVIATAREPLGLDGEHVYELRPLAEAPAVELLRASAEALDPDFDAPWAELARVARRVGRVPAALEAAARELVRVAP